MNTAPIRILELTTAARKGDIDPLTAIEAIRDEALTWWAEQSGLSAKMRRAAATATEVDSLKSRPDSADG